MNAGKKLMTCFCAVLAAGIFFLAWYALGHKPDARLNFGGTAPLEQEMREDGNRRLYTAVLPEAFESAQSLLFKSTHEKVEIFVDNETVYTYGMETSRLGKSPGTYWHVAAIPAKSAGKTLTVRLTTVYDHFYGSETRIRYGSRGDCILTLVRGFLPVLVLNCIIIAVGLISLFLHFVTLKRKEKRELGSFLCIGLFSLTIALWSLRQCGFLQFLIPNGRVLYFVDLHLFFLFPVPLNLFIYTICRSRYKKGFAFLAAAYLIEMASETALQILGILDIFEMLRTIHALMLLNALYTFWAVHKEGKEETDSMGSRIRVPLYVLMAFGILEMISYYIRLFDDISIFLPTGTMVFIVMLIWMQVKEYYRNMLEEQKVLYYEKLANTDLLTGAYNRNAYENALKRLEESQDGPQGQGVVLFDLNNMKRINDNYGHDKGDEAIRRCYECILSVFGEKGRCYRIGGDEFVFLSGGELDMERCIGRFEELVEESKKSLEFPFSVAHGYAVFDGGRDGDFRDTIRRSDAMMYMDKKAKKRAMEI